MRYSHVWPGSKPQPEIIKQTSMAIYRLSGRSRPPDRSKVRSHTEYLRRPFQDHSRNALLAFVKRMTKFLHQHLIDGISRLRPMKLDKTKRTPDLYSDSMIIHDSHSYLR